MGAPSCETSLIEVCFGVVSSLSLPVENQIVKQLIVWQGAENRRAARPQSNPD
jgi:hypothetical protein